ncbi:MAG TPA: HlyD family secretion protein [Lacunisphaera sp.]|nr:HlyD family secretion protein [Lacunisphaera sp.]
MNATLPPDSPVILPFAPVAAAVPATLRRRRLTGLVLTAGVVLAAALGWLGWSARDTETTDSAFIDGHRVTVAAQVAGRVAGVLVDDNQRVEAGQLLLRLDPADFQVKLDQAEAAQAQAEAALAHARAQLPVTEAAARAARAQVEIAAANARKTAGDLRRYRQLSDDAVSRIALDAVVTQEAVAAAQLEAARQAAAGAEAQIGLAQTAVTTAAANLRAATALVAQARLALSYTEVRAPAAGYVTRKNVEPGNFIGPGQPVLNLVTADLFVTANFKETQLTHLRPGQPVTLTVDTYPGLELHGRVESRMAGTGSAFALLPPENATGNFVKVVQRVPVKITFDRDALYHLPPLALGMSVVATVDVAAPTAAHVVTLNR